MKAMRVGGLGSASSRPSMSLFGSVMKMGLMMVRLPFVIRARGAIAFWGMDGRGLQGTELDWRCEFY